MAPPGAFDQPYLSLGSHPDVVVKVWDQLGAVLPPAARCVVLGRPALSDPGCGVILALTLGTAYALRLAEDDLGAALTAGLRPSHTYNVPGSTLDAEATFGPTWLFGRFDANEPAWLAAAARELERSPGA